MGLYLCIVVELTVNVLDKPSIAPYLSRNRDGELAAPVNFRAINVTANVKAICPNEVFFGTKGRLKRLGGFDRGFR
jgi:hypothetical protein